MKKKTDDFITFLEDGDILPPLTKEQKNVITNKLKQYWNNIFGLKPPENFTTLHDLPNSEIEALVETINGIVEGDYSAIERIVKKYDQVLYDLNKLKQTLKKIPNDDLVRQKEQELDDLQIEKGKLIKSIEDEEFNEQKIQEAILAAKKKLDNLLNKVELSKKVEKKVNASKKIREVLNEFIQALTYEKAHDVQFYLTEMFSKLARKKDLVKEFKINPLTFEVTFENFNNEILPKRRLSAGEKAIYAISLVWALAQASQRPLPIVIDTPIGRMDKDHRTNLLNHYFPNANRQVIILSTDEEVADEWKEMINEYIAKEYLLISQGEETKIYKGYFGGGDLVEL